MKIAITGTTRGLGKALCGFLKNNNHDLIEFNRNDGFDISLDSGRKNIIDNLILEDVDVFINNAWDKEGQLKIFNEVIKIYRDCKNKTIININSRTALLPYNMKPNYDKSKKDLKEQTAQYLFNPPRPKIINVYPGFIDTELNRKNNIGQVLSLNECCEIIYWAMNTPPHIEISDLGFLVINK